MAAKIWKKNLDKSWDFSGEKLGNPDNLDHLLPERSCLYMCFALQSNFAQ